MFMKKLTKVLIGLLVAAGTALQNDQVQHAIANFLGPIVSAHPKVSIAVGAVSAILALIHDPKPASS